MTRSGIVLLIFAFLFALFLASYQESPGYMDADYYLLGGEALIQGKGFEENVLWNYLDDPAALPHPSHAYWLPGSSFLAAAALRLNPDGGFNQAQWSFILVASLVPFLTYALAFRLYARQPPNQRARSAMIAGSLALFPGYYAGFLTTTDSFGLYMVFGALFFLAFLSDLSRTPRAILMGVVVGLMHLTRTDGFIWLVVAAWLFWKKDERRAIPVLLLAYLAVMSPWFIRNGNAFGSILAPGGIRALWWTEYNDLFAFPADILTPLRWFQEGWIAIFRDRLAAAWLNFSSTIAVGGMVFLFPLILLGFWRRRKELVVQGGMLGWGFVFGLMTVIFPYAGSRGGYFHAGAALQPLFWSLVPEGLESFLAWGRQKRGWQVAKARLVFGAGLVVIAAIVTGFLGWTRIIAPSIHTGITPPYLQVETFLQDSGAAASDIVMVNNPPGYALQTDRSAIVIPTGGLSPILAAGERYGAAYLILGDQQGLPEIFDEPDGQPGLIYLGESEGLKIFGFENAP